MSKKNICFYARSAQRFLYAKVGKKLEDAGYKVCYIVQNNQEEADIKNQESQGDIYNLDKYLHDNWNNKTILDSVKFNEAEKFYDINSLWSLLYVDRYLVSYSFDDAVKFIKLHITFFQYIIKDFSPQLLINEEIAIFSSFLFYKIGAKHNCKYYGFSIPKQFGDKYVALVENEKSNYFILDENYAKGLYTEKHLKEAKSFIEKFRKEKIIPPYLIKGKFSKIKPKFKIRFFKQLLKYIVSEMVVRRNDPINYMEYGNQRYLYEIKNYLRYQKQKKYYNKPDFSEKYIFFPLHYQPEATTLVNAQNYEKQQCALDLIAKKIPGDYILYVKEHYSVLGHREMDLYRLLDKMPNVKFIDPFEDSHALIKNAKAVIVLTGTAGWESILYGVPTFVLGNVFFNSFKYAVNVKNINDLTVLLKRHIKIKNNDYEQELIRFVAALLSSLFPGYYYLLDKEKVESIENINNITNIVFNLSVKT